MEEAVQVREVEFIDSEVDPLNVEMCSISLLLRGVVVVGEAVEAHDVMAAPD